jgi:hypothetical protein
MQCQNCGNVNRQGVKFCSKCGKPLQASAVPQQPPSYAPPAPPSPSPLLQPQMQQPVTPYPAAMPQQYSPVAAPRKLPLDKIGIGCGGMFLGLLCGILSTVGVIEGPKMFPTSTTTPTTTPASAPVPATPPATQPTPPRKEPVPTKPGGMSYAHPGMVRAFQPVPGDPATAFVAMRVDDRALVLNGAPSSCWRIDQLVRVTQNTKYGNKSIELIRSFD